MEVMEKTRADNAVKGFSDISGVKEEGLAAEVPVQNKAPEESAESFDAARSDDEALTPSGVRFEDVLPEDDSASDGTNEGDLDAEFEALIKGRYRRAYQKRMADTVRRRLRSGRARSASKATPEMCEEASAVCETAENAEKTENAEVAASVPPTDRQIELIEAQRSKNRSRPTENGVGGSVGIVTRINVSALSGNDILGIIRRAGTGEKITF